VAKQGIKPCFSLVIIIDLIGIPLGRVDPRKVVGFDCGGLVQCGGAKRRRTAVHEPIGV